MTIIMNPNDVTNLRFQFALSRDLLCDCFRLYWNDGRRVSFQFALSRDLLCDAIGEDANLRYADLVSIRSVARPAL